MLPDTLRGIKFRAVSWELVDFEPMPVGFEPTPDIFIFVIRSVVLNQHCPAASIVTAESLQESSVRGGVEYGVLGIVKAHTPELNRAKDLHVLTLSSNWNFWRTAYPAPCRV